ncbi:hypothetical protein [uncultured Mycobacterium sp.]|uniref:hypothetical protein n=1 Tax=uncultured Mycobacterium sp. TaxID=171292 RepID=UPI0035CC17D3
MIKADDLGREMSKCPDCQVFKRETWNWDREPQPHVWTLHTGRTRAFGATTIPLSTNFVPCEKHRKELERRRGGL